MSGDLRQHAAVNEGAERTSPPVVGLPRLSTDERADVTALVGTFARDLDAIVERIESLARLAPGEAVRARELLYRRYETVAGVVREAERITTPSRWFG